MGLVLGPLEWGALGLALLLIALLLRWIDRLDARRVRAAVASEAPAGADARQEGG